LQPVSRFAQGQFGASYPHGLEQDLDATCASIAAHDGKRPPHGMLGVALQVYEVAGCCMLRAARCFQRDDELLCSQRFVVGHAGTFLKDGVSPSFHACMVTGIDRSIGFEPEH